MHFWIGYGMKKEKIKWEVSQFSSVDRCLALLCNYLRLGNEREENSSYSVS